MAQAMPPGDYAISVAHGFKDALIEGNRIDVRGGNSAVVVLAGNHWNLRLLNNELLGGGESLRLQSTPTEAPHLWGWSHTPFFGALCQGNLHGDSRRGLSIDVHSDKHTKSYRGRTYLSGAFQDNTIRRQTQTTASLPQALPPIRIGYSSGEDPAQMRLEVRGNQGITPAGPESEMTVGIRSATINGEAVRDR